MKIIISTADTDFEFDGDGVRTDEHNNLEITRSGTPLGLFNSRVWQAALYGEEID